MSYIIEVQTSFNITGRILLKYVPFIIEVHAIFTEAQAICFEVNMTFIIELQAIFIEVQAIYFEVHAIYQRSSGHLSIIIKVQATYYLSICHNLLLNFEVQAIYFEVQAIYFEVQAIY